MANRISTVTIVCRIWRHLLPRRKKQLVFLAGLMIIASFAEVVSIGAVLPFLSLLISPQEIFAQEVTQSTIAFLKIQFDQNLLLAFTLIFILATLFAGLARLALLWVQTRLSMAIGADFSVQVYERTLYQHW